MTGKELGQEDAFPGPDNWSVLTKREYFAGLAMQGLIIEPCSSKDLEQFSAVAVQHADALLDALAEEETPDADEND